MSSSDNDFSQKEQKELLKLLREQKKIAHETQESLEKLRKYIVYSSLFSTGIKVFVIIIPLIVALFYLPPFIEELVLQLQAVTSTPGASFLIEAFK